MKKLLYALLMIAGCAPAGGSLPQKYLENARKVGLHGVYPPRESFQVGDLFVVSDSGGPDVGSVWVGEMPSVATLAQQFMGTRIVFGRSDFQPATEGKGLLSNNGNDLITAGLARRSEYDVRDLPIVSYPEFTANAGRSGGFVFARALGAFGLSSNASTTVNLQFHDVRSYGVEPAFLYSRVQGGNGTRGLAELVKSKLTSGAFRLDPVGVRTGICASLASQEQEGLTIAPASSSRDIYVSLITRVYLTREITYTYSDANIRAAGLRQSAAAGKVAPPVAAPIVVVNTNGQVDSDTVGKALKGVTDSLTTALNSNAAGSSFDFVSWDALGLTFSQRYARPVVIAYDQLLFRVADLADVDDPLDQTNRLLMTFGCKIPSASPEVATASQNMGAAPEAKPNPALARRSDPAKGVKIAVPSEGTDGALCEGDLAKLSYKQACKCNSTLCPPPTTNVGPTSIKPQLKQE